MPDQTTSHVCLLIDFENLVLGLKNMVQGDLAEELDVGLLFRLAEEHGPVVLANAYADWRNTHFNQFQIDLDRQGIDLIHVLGRGYKNAVDVKLAVDAIETLWTLPHIQTFVIVSGDRDFIHILKTLRRHGKKIVGVAPDVSASEDFAGLCDSFVKYSALKRTYSDAGDAAAENAPEDRGRLENALTALLSKHHVQGVKGATLKQLLKRELGQTFDESEYGYAKFSELLLSLPQIARIEAPAYGDIVVFPADGDASAPSQGFLPRRFAPPAQMEAETAESRLRDYHFQPDAEKRRSLLRRIFETMQAASVFHQEDILRLMLDNDPDLRLSGTTLGKYFAILYQSHAFVIQPNQEGVPVRLRKFQLKPRFANAQDAIEAYEYSIALKVCAADKEMDALALCGVLGLDAAKPEDASYCIDLHKRARAQLARLPATETPRIAPP